MIRDIDGDIIRHVFRVVAVTAAQVMVFVLLYEAAIEAFGTNGDWKHRIFGFGMQLRFGFWLIVTLAGLNTLAHFLFERIEHGLIATLVCTGLWIGYWGNIADVVPNRFLAISFLGSLSFLVGVLFSSRQTKLAVDY